MGSGADQLRTDCHRVGHGCRIGYRRCSGRCGSVCHHANFNVERIDGHANPSAICSSDPDRVTVHGSQRVCPISNRDGGPDHGSDRCSLYRDPNPIDPSPHTWYHRRTSITSDRRRIHVPDDTTCPTRRAPTGQSEPYSSRSAVFPTCDSARIDGPSAARAWPAA